MEMEDEELGRKGKRKRKMDPSFTQWQEVTIPLMPIHKIIRC
jgi:hypothetical protein